MGTKSLFVRIEQAMRQYYVGPKWTKLCWVDQDPPSLSWPFLDTLSASVSMQVAVVWAQGSDRDGVLTSWNREETYKKAWDIFAGISR